MDMPQTKTDYFPLVGGLDTESAMLSKKSGVAIGGVNYESSQESGYERLAGFERFNGMARPSDATFTILGTAGAFTGVVVGDTINGQTSGAVGRIIALSGTNKLILSLVTGAFALAENIRLVTTVIGVYDVTSNSLTSFDDNTYSGIAADFYRTLISAVPGSGDMRGIAMLGSTVYAFRDNAGATALAIYKSTSGGWVNVPLMRELSFNVGGGTAPVEGATLTKGGVTCVLRRLIVTSGSWGATTAAGRMIVDTVTGGPFTAGAFTAGVTATITVVDAAITLLPGGRLDHAIYNFTGSTDTERIYGCDGVNFGFEFDGTTLVPIRTGMTSDIPKHVATHKNHLFFSFKGSVQHSGISTPYIWSVVFGAAEIAIGQEVVGFSNLPGDVDAAPLMIFSTNRTLVMYGTSSADWKLVTYSSSIGAQRWSVQNIGNPIVFNSLGVVPVVQSQEFGNFTSSPASEKIRTYLKNKVISSSVVNRQQNRVRMFFSNGEAISITPVGGSLLFMVINYGKTISCSTEANISGVSRNFFAGSDGFVYEADVGRSFDGSAIEAWIKLAFNHTGSPSLKKRFRKVDIEVKSQSAFALSVQGEYSLGRIDIGMTTLNSLQVAGLGGIYDFSNWDQCYFDSSSQSSVSVRIDGVGTNMSLIFSANSSNELSHLLQSVTTSYTPRRIER